MDINFLEIDDKGLNDIVWRILKNKNFINKYEISEDKLYLLF